MKTKILSLAAVGAASVALFSCTKEAVSVDRPQGTSSDFLITAAVPASRTTNSGMSTLWAAGDAINVYHSAASAADYTFENPFTITEENLASNKFTGTMKSELDAEASYDWLVLYPYSAEAASPAAVPVTIGCAASGSQTQSGNDSKAHICGAALPAWGKASAVKGSSSVNVSLDNLATLVSFEILNTSSSESFTLTGIELTCGDNDLCGEFTVDLTGAAPVYTAVNASKTAVLNVENVSIAKLSTATVTLAVAPFSSKNFTITVKGADSYTYTKSFELSSALTFSAGKVKTLSVKTSADPVYKCTENVVPMPSSLDGKLSGAVFIDNNRLAYSTISGTTNDQLWVYDFSTGTNTQIAWLGTGATPWKIAYNENDGRIYYASKDKGWIRWIDPDTKEGDAAVKNDDGSTSYFSGRACLDLEFDKDYNMIALFRDSYYLTKFSLSSNYGFSSRKDGYVNFNSPKQPLAMCKNHNNVLYVAVNNTDGTGSRIFSYDMTSDKLGTLCWNTGAVNCMMADAENNLWYSNSVNKIYKVTVASDGTGTVSSLTSDKVIGWPSSGFQAMELVPSPTASNEFYVVDNAFNKIHKFSIL